MTAVLVIIFIIVAVFGPIWTINAMNLLFGLTIPLTFWTYLSTAWLMALVYGEARSK